MNLIRLKPKLITLASVLMALSGCAQVAEVMGYDTQTLNAAAAKSYTQMIGEAKANGEVETNTPVAKRVNTIFQRLVPYANEANQTGVPFDWQLNVINSEIPNAFAMPGGKMVVYTGIVNRLNLSDDEIAAIIGHEMTHALQEHSKKAAGQQILTSVALEIGSSALQSKTGASANNVGIYKDVLNQFGLTLPFSRHQESLADAGGLKLMAQAGYDPHAAITVWEKMNKVMGNNRGTSLLSTHPSNDARINALKKMLPEVLPVYEQAKQNNLTMQKTGISQSKNTQGSGARKGTTKKKSRS
ncbi:Zn-dependent protease with chaperone function [Snodgrassella alvi wkB2]|uniref:M48 family metallopeptidase n=1 Tax=Snodgrassella alvi TaxID=1196083 RepID=A0ABD7YZT4_9NEIS|nr:M48 family metallopeptidase [Snodgrassella alvi]AHN28659.1 Zn-dependent protease with chaperone function [Snodgrassella alvi wkB2]OOX77998.1 deoxyribonuclease HsdR [Snodgrassella alvi]ORF01188.1 deoxyribonuclease HsdR [Snodgrassella alvi]PIT44075.1 deoxyribonuclease HsdR [Snodgrassella alvi]PIT66705.1 deoxyribonuclease HsdR [Snodgrassella alvi]